MVFLATLQFDSKYGSKNDVNELCHWIWHNGVILDIEYWLQHGICHNDDLAQKWNTKFWFWHGISQKYALIRLKMQVNISLLKNYLENCFSFCCRGDSNANPKLTKMSTGFNSDLTWPLTFSGQDISSPPSSLQNPKPSPPPNHSHPIPSLLSYTSAKTLSISSKSMPGSSSMASTKTHLSLPISLTPMPILAISVPANKSSTLFLTQTRPCTLVFSDVCTGLVSMQKPFWFFKKWSWNQLTRKNVYTLSCRALVTNC